MKLPVVDDTPATPKAPMRRGPEGSGPRTSPLESEHTRGEASPAAAASPLSFGGRSQPKPRMNFAFGVTGEESRERFNNAENGLFTGLSLFSTNPSRVLERARVGARFVPARPPTGGRQTAGAPSHPSTLHTLARIGLVGAKRRLGFYSGQGRSLQSFKASSRPLNLASTSAFPVGPFALHRRSQPSGETTLAQALG